MTLSEFLSHYAAERSVTTIEVPQDFPDRPFVVVKAGEFAVVLDLMRLDKHLCIDVHPFVEGESAAAAAFGMDSRVPGQLDFAPGKALSTSHGRDAMPLVSLLVGVQGVNVDNAVNAAVERAKAEGAREGENAGACFLPSSAGAATYAKVSKGLDDGDPEVLDMLPWCDLSGQWADGRTATDIALNHLDALGVEVLQLPEWPSLRDEIADAYESAYNDALRAEVERVCSYHLTETTEV